jgi:adenylate kinase family enzyme
LNTQNIVLLLASPHGAGKNNVAKNIRTERPEMVHISAGEVLRYYADQLDPHRHPDEPLVTIGEIQNRGDLVTTATCGDMLVSYVHELGICCNNGLILDGFPRDCEQVDILECRLKQMGLNHPHMYGFHLTLSEREQRKRLSQRIDRADATPEALERRTDVYISYVIPAIDQLRTRGVPFVDLCVDDDGELWGSEMAADEILGLLDSGKLGRLAAVA